VSHERRKRLRLRCCIENIWAVRWNELLMYYARFMVARDSRLIAPARAAVEELAGTICESVRYCYFADMLLCAGHAEEAVTWADKALAELGSGSYYSAETRAHRIRSTATFLLPGASWASVSRDMETSLRFAMVQERIPDLAINHFCYAELLGQHGACDEAKRNLESAERHFRDLKMSWWSGQAARLRVELED
jgi:hypothetical protein